MSVCYVASMRHTCSPAEYKVMGECCPMCNPGYHVYRHCTEYTSTTCAPCPQSSYTEAHNGLVSCKKCTVCDSTAGVRVKKNCSSTSDTLCEPLEGHYCIDPIKDGCQGAVKHTKCKPGQYIKQKGTASSDTECSDCGSNTYSDGSFTSCRPHTHQQRLYFLCKQKHTSAPPPIITAFYRGTIQSISSCITRYTICRALTIMNDETQPAHNPFSLLASGKSRLMFYQFYHRLGNPMLCTIVLI
ncbi:tumor necrosis factor receptor superfamily member 14-like [Engraulis encrasicolus]|uniref:tumor necrosis factor receptor superfamily member 14-like n=1 Tax=Engraulis encrasicolus TaxID=184585 RepID=UPI002FD77656